MSPILITTEQAFVNFVSSASIDLGYTPETDIFIRSGMDNQDNLAPSVVCYASTAVEEIQFSGIYRMTVNVDITEIAEDTNRSDIGVLPDKIYRKFLVSGIEAQLTNAVSNYYVYQLQIDKTEDIVSGDAWTQRYSFEIVCALKS